MTEPVREAIYGVITAILALAAAFGAIDAESVTQLATAAASLLGALTTLLAFANTNKVKHED